MRHLHWSLVLVGLLLAASPAPAQSFILNNPYGYDYGGSGVWINYTHHHHHTTLSISAGRFAAPAFSIGPVFGPFWGPALPSVVIPPLYGPVINQQVTVVNYRPPPAVLPGPFVLDDLTLAILPRPEPELPLNPRPLPDRNKPKDREKKPAQPEPAPQPRPEAPKPPQPKPPDMPRIPHPDPEPRGEYARLIELGKESFADTDYGLAAQRFRQATTVLANDGLARLLLAQALLALGKYQDAVDAIYTGMTAEPNWPVSNFHPLDLYGAHVALYPDHLHRLEDAVGRHPNDAVVLFLFGYELWFDGRKDEARGLFQKAAAAGADAVVIDRFFRALPPAGGV
jgi:hypothetical protein